MTRLLWILAAMLAGCAAGAKPQAAAMNVPGVPSPLDIELHTVSKAGRSTYHHVHPDGTLQYGGGRDAIVSAAQPYGKITPEQLKRIWAVIEKNKLIEGKGRMFAKREKVSYKVGLTAGDVRVNYIAVDQEVPGLDELDQLLFKMQAERRYKDVSTPVDEKLREQREYIEAQKAKNP